MRRTSALIAGGGPAGAAAAIRLARSGARPVLIERSAGPHDSVCGGFLGWDALAELDRLGIDTARLGARPITTLRLITGRRHAEAPLPHAAAGLSRRALDAALLDHAEAQGAGIERGIAIRRAEGPTLHLADGGEIAGDALFLATGKHELRGLPRPGAEGGAVGLRTTLDPSRSLAQVLHGMIELHLFEGGYAGMLAQEDGAINLCLSVAPARMAEAGSPERLMENLAREAPILGHRFGDGTAAGPWSAVAGVPYGWRATAPAPGLFRLGDQAAVIASLAGDGIAIALASARLAAEAWAREGAQGALTFQPVFAATTRRPLAVASAMRRLGERPRVARPLLGLFGALPAIPALLARLTRTGSPLGD